MICWTASRVFSFFAGLIDSVSSALPNSLCDYSLNLHQHFEMCLLTRGSGTIHRSIIPPIESAGGSATGSRFIVGERHRATRLHLDRGPNVAWDDPKSPVAYSWCCKSR